MTVPPPDLFAVARDLIAGHDPLTEGDDVEVRLAGALLQLADAAERIAKLTKKPPGKRQRQLDASVHAIASAALRAVGDTAGRPA